MNDWVEEASSSARDAALAWLILLQSPELTASQEQAFFVWLQACPGNQQAFVEVESLWQRGAALSKTSRFKRWSSILRFDWLFGGWRLGAFTGLCAALLVALFVGVKPSHQDINYQTAYGEQKQVILEEGSVITLNANSEVVVNLHSSQNRSLTLNKGEAFFDVAVDKSRPFIVKTKEGLVVVLGTQFSVSKIQGATEVTVIEGKVGLLPDEESWEGQIADVELSANEQLVLDSSKTEPRPIDADQVLAWRGGQLRFEGEPLSEVIRSLNAYYNQSVTLADGSLGRKKVVAVFPLADGFEANVKHLEQALSLQSIIDSSGMVKLSLRED